MLRETYLRPAVIINALVLTAIATVLALAIYVIPQQVLRQGANDPQIELAENLARSLKSGVPVEMALPMDAMNAAPNKSYFFITSDGKGLPGTPPTDLTGKFPPLPPPPGVQQNVEIREKKNGDLSAPGGLQKQVRTMTFQTDGKASPKVKITGSQNTQGNTPQNMQSDVEELGDGQTQVDGGKSTFAVTIPDDSIDMAQSLSPFLIAYDAQGNPVGTQAKLNGKIPAPPKGVFENVRSNGEERFSWEPQPGVRIAAVMLHIPAGANVKEGFVVAGRSLREVEVREKQLGQLAFINWLVMMGLIVVGMLAFGYFTRAKVTIAAV